jgi:Tol biopolymer transport system component
MSAVHSSLQAYRGDAPYAFVCYAHEDTPRVFPLLTRLTDAGVPFWFDEGISPGNTWRDELARAIDRCGVFLYFVTPASAASRNCQRECGYALDRDKPMLAVHLEETLLPSGLTLSLADQQAILGYRYPETIFEAKLVDAVRQLLGTAAAAPVARREPRRWRQSLQRALPRLGRSALGATLLLVVATGVLLGARLLPERAPTAMTVELRRLTDVVGLEEAPALSPKGDTIAFVGVAGGRRQIWVRHVAGGTPIAVTRADVDHYAPRWAPDSSSLIYYTPGTAAGEQGTIWAVPALGGPERRITTALAPGDFGSSGEIAFFRYTESGIELAAATQDNLEIRTIERLPRGVYGDLRWSPDARRLAFTATGTGAQFSSRLTVVPAQGGELRVIADRYYLRGIDWLPDGAGFVASSARGSLMSYPPTYNLWRIPLDGGESRQLTFGEFSYEHPDVGTDGSVVASRVAIQSDVWRFPTSGEPRANAEAGERVTRQTGLLQTLTIAPDETEVAFLSDSGGHANVWAARIADGVMRPLTREMGASVVIAVPAWSPRGDRIAFLSSRSTKTAEVTLWLVRPDGSDLKDLGLVGAWACWSPDGSMLYYSAEVAGNYEIHKVPVDGGAPTLVRADNAVGCGRHGDTLYYTRALDTDFGPWDLEIRAATPEDGESRVLGSVAGVRVPSSAFDLQPIPSPDGNWLAMPLLEGATTNLWALSTQTGEWRRLTDFTPRNVVIARRIAWSPSGAHLYASVSDIDSDIVLMTGLLSR